MDAANASLKATIDNFHQEQRAWVGVSGISVTSGTLKVGDTIAADIGLINTGKTPGMELKPYFTSAIRGKNAAFTVELPAHVEGGFQSIAVILPGPVQGNAHVPEIVGKDNKVIKLTQAYLDELSSGETIYYVWGAISYKDVFTHPHETRVCAFLNTDLRTFRACKQYNSAN